MVRVVDGRLKYSIQWSHYRPVPAVMIGVWALPQGIPVGDLHFGNMGAASNQPPDPSCVQAQVSSDSQGMFGCECPKCRGYWRSAINCCVCPYCAFVAERLAKNLH